MSSHFKNAVSWGHNVAPNEEKASRIIDITKSVATFEQDQDDRGFYVVLSPREGQQFSQPTRLNIIMNCEKGHLERHKASDVYKKFESAADSEGLLEKPASDMSCSPEAGYIVREEASKAPLKNQYVWIAKLDSHPGKFDEFLDAIKIHASNIERTENQTLSFLVLRSHDTENSVTLFERYTNEE